MTPKLISEDQAFRLGNGVGREAADMLRIEIVAAVHLRCMDALDECCRVTGPSGPLGEFSDTFEKAWWGGLRGRCAEIIERLNCDRAARLPA